MNNCDILPLRTVCDKRTKNKKTPTATANYHFIFVGYVRSFNVNISLIIRYSNLHKALTAYLIITQQYTASQAQKIRSYFTFIVSFVFFSINLSFYTIFFFVLICTFVTVGEVFYILPDMSFCLLETIAGNPCFRLYTQISRFLCWCFIIY